jgi:hypothetical protein
MRDKKCAGALNAACRFYWRQGKCGRQDSGHIRRKRKRPVDQLTRRNSESSSVSFEAAGFLPRELQLRCVQDRTSGLSFDKPLADKALIRTAFERALQGTRRPDRIFHPAVPDHKLSATRWRDSSTRSSIFAAISPLATRRRRSHSPAYYTSSVF